MFQTLVIFSGAPWLQEGLGVGSPRFFEPRRPLLAKQEPSAGQTSHRDGHWVSQQLSCSTSVAWFHRHGRVLLMFSRWQPQEGICKPSNDKGIELVTHWCFPKAMKRTLGIACSACLIIQQVIHVQFWDTPGSKPEATSDSQMGALPMFGWLQKEAFRKPPSISFWRPRLILACNPACPHTPSIP